MITKLLRLLSLMAIVITFLGKAAIASPVQAAPPSQPLPEGLPAELTTQDWEQIQPLIAPTQQAYLKASNTEANDGYGFSFALSGDTLVVGAPYEDSNALGVNGSQSNNLATNSGAVYILTRDG
ncbi:MAG TPA: FG-GAP repeat protein, partial [Anaerolineales bacterium]|nr:FG-GAP repeat protein [Anaerolineales bacterium]